MEKLAVYPKNKKQMAAFIALATYFKIDFEKEESPYNPEFVARIRKSEQQMKDGKVTRITRDEIKEFCK